MLNKVQFEIAGKMVEEGSLLEAQKYILQQMVRGIKEMKYLYIFEDGTTNKSDTAPQEGDLTSIKEGILDIFVFVDEDIFQLNHMGKNNEIEETEIRDNDYHAPA